MPIHTIEPTAETLHGHFSRDLPPALTVAPGDTVRFRTLDASWSVFNNPDPFTEAPKFAPWNRVRDSGHALCGPVAVSGAEPGMTLEVRLDVIRPGAWGWSCAGGFATGFNKRLGLAEGERWDVRWRLDADALTGTSQYGQTVPLRPFMGVMGMPPDTPGSHSTAPPRFCGGNVDCRELVAGSRLYLPVAVPGGLFSLGDGHALQGDGEVSGVALECPMERVDVTFDLHANMPLAFPRAHTPAGWVTFGFHEDLDEAVMIALDGMLDLLGALHGMGRKEALAFSTLLVDLRVTQIVNGVKGAHAVLPHDALTR